ncbi:MAG: hypothetical protein E7473_09450 [Ruminococcaceae bacterium]|nr:hypothetical protein [Oscillospiraceae bacterium]
MLRYDVAMEWYENIKEKGESVTDEDLKDIYRAFLRSAVDYTSKRTEWTFMDWSERDADGGNRSSYHEGFMSRLRSVCRNFGIDGLEETMPDRKTKGDFACYVTLFLSLEQR